MSDVVTKIYQEPDGRLVIVSQQECDPILERNKRLANEPQNNETFRHVGTIPNGVILQWLDEQQKRGNPIRSYLTDADFTKLMFDRVMNDSDYRHLRTY